MKTVGQITRENRERKEITRKRLSELSGVSVNVIKDIEHGRCNPRLATVELLADALGLSIDEYVGHRTVKREALPQNNKKC